MLCGMTETLSETTPSEATPSELALPTYPRTVPGLRVLLRKPGEIQFGLDPRHALVATDVPAELIDTLRTLDGLLSLDTLLTQAGAEHAGTLRAVLRELARHGLLEETRAPDSGVSDEPEHSSLRAGRHARNGRAQARVVMHGGGRTAVAAATLLATAGVGHIDSHRSGTVGLRDLGTGYLEADVGFSYPHAMSRAVRRANPKTTTSRLSDRSRPTLAVLADSVVPDPELALTMFADGVPHLPVRVRDGIGIVGPLVVPGRTSCLRCADLHRCDIDPCWPAVATQLAGRSTPTELGTAHALAALATGQILRALNPADRAPGLWNATLEIDPYAGEVQRRSWPPHPDCTCGAFHGYH